MRKFIWKLILFIAILVAVDLALGQTIRLYDYIRGGDIGKAHQVMTMIKPDVLVLGSSRASHHYDSDTIGEILGKEVFNAGFNGQGSLMAYGLLQGVKSRKTPEVVVYELTPLFDVFEDSGSSSINMLAPYKDTYGLDSLFYDIDSTNRYKMLAKSYAYNSALLRMLPNILLRRSQNIDGYEPLYGELREPAKTNITPGRKHRVDSVKLKYFKKIICEARNAGCRVVFTMSPTLIDDDDAYYRDMLDIAENMNIPVFDHSRDTAFINHPYYFQDNTHMNYKGAEKYSKVFAEELGDYLAAKSEPEK